jgi:DNA-binding CsgD family transcriptional regulator
VTPLRTREALPGNGDGLAAILITDPARPRTTTPAELAATFGITQAEARILRLLADGQSVSEAGAALGVSLLTARTHVRNMFLKMGCTRQAELIRTVITHPTWMLDRD